MARLVSWLVLLVACLLPMAAGAQQQGLEIDIVGGNAAALPIAVVPFQNGVEPFDVRLLQDGNLNFRDPFAEHADEAR